MNLKKGLCKRLLIVSALALLLSCEKEPKGHPEVRIESPSFVKSYNVFDTIQVRAFVSDPDLKQVNLTVVDAHYTPILPVLNIPLRGKQFSFDEPYVLSDIHMESGTYFVRVRATNGDHTSNAFQQILISEVPRRRTGIYLLSHHSAGVQVQQLDSVFNPTSAPLSFPGDYSSSAISSYEQQLYVAAHTSGMLSTLSTKDNNTVWTVPHGGALGFPYFEQLYYADRKLYVSFSDGWFRAYNAFGHQQRSFRPDMNFYMGPMIKVGNDLIGQLIAKNTGSINKIVRLYEGTGALQSELPVNAAISNLFVYDDNTLFVCGTDANGGFMKLYSISANGLSEPVSLSIGQINDAVQINANQYLIAHEGGILSYQYQPFVNLLNYLNSPAQELGYDPVNRELLVLNNNTVAAYDYLSKSLKYSYTGADSVVAFHILYNK